MDRLHPEYRVITVNLKGNIALENYLSNFPLFGSKHLDYLDWKTLIKMKKEKAYLNEKGRLLMQNIKSSMNSGR